MRTKRIIAALGVSTFLVAGLAACSSSDNDSKADKPSTTTEAMSSAACDNTIVDVAAAHGDASVIDTAIRQALRRNLATLPELASAVGYLAGSGRPHDPGRVRPEAVADLGHMADCLLLERRREALETLGDRACDVIGGDRYVCHVFSFFACELREPGLDPVELGTD